jgi:Cu/Zn superoxide dismutase
MKRFILFGALLLLPVVVLAACGGDDGGEGPAAAAPENASSSDQVTVELAEQNNSGESGIATLTATGASTRVVLEMKNPTTDSQPAHIHRGSCENLDADPLHGLLNVIQGRSETVVNVPLSELTAGGLALNVHQSNAKLDTYVACGNLPGDTADVTSSDDGGY